MGSTQSRVVWGVVSTQVDVVVVGWGLLRVDVVVVAVGSTQVDVVVVGWGLLK